MQHNDNHRGKRRRSRTKQTLQAPRHVDRNAEQQLKNLVWVTIGKTEHQAWLLEDVKGKNVVMVRWETTGSEQKVPVLSIRHEAPDNGNGRRSRRRRTSAQDSSQDLDHTNIQAPKKRKRRQTSKKVTEKNRTVIKQNEQSEGEGIVTLEARVESNRLAWGPSSMADLPSNASLDTMIPNGGGILAKEKVSGETKSIEKASSQEAAKTKASELSEIWENAKRTALSTYADQSASSTVAKSSKSSKTGEESISDTPEPDEEEQSNEKDGYLI